MQTSRWVTIMTLGLAITACGDQSHKAGIDAGAESRQGLGSDTDVITDATFEAVVAEKEFSDRSNAPECLALRGEINVLRPTLLAKTEWLSLVKTQHWDQLKTAYSAYTDAKCPPITLPAAEISESCANLRGNVITAWNDVHGSAEYQVVEQHDTLSSLLDKWNRAKTSGCIAQ